MRSLLKEQPRTKRSAAEQLRPEIPRGHGVTARGRNSLQAKLNLESSLTPRRSLFVGPQRQLSWGAWQNQPPTYPGRAPGPLTEWGDNGAGDAVGHDDSEDTQHPRIHGSKLILEGLALEEAVRRLQARSPPRARGRARWRTWEIREAHGHLNLSKSLLFLRKPSSASLSSDPDLARYSDACFF